MEIGDKIEGKIIKITKGSDNETYITLEFEGYGKATIKQRK